jgi:purine-binding chemotaxis protein CheW
MTAKETLKTRARALAGPTASPATGAATANEDAGAVLEVVEFRLASETYAIERALVRSVLPLKDLTPLPGTPSFVRGVVNVRGQIVPVIDIRKFFDLPEAGIADVHMIIIVHHQGVELGIDADAVTTVRAFPLSAIAPSLPTLTGIRAQYLKGVSRDHVVILDAAKILSDPKIVVDEQVEAIQTPAEMIL